jgi:hypothetical protein
MGGMGLERPKQDNEKDNLPLMPPYFRIERVGYDMENSRGQNTLKLFIFDCRLLG